MRSSHRQDLVNYHVMTPQTGKTASGGSWRLAYRFLESLKMKWVIVFLPLVLGGCQLGAGFLADQLGSTTARIERLAEYKSAYKTRYTKSECAVIFNDAPSGVTAFLLVDGLPADDAGFTYCQFDRIFVSPGPHRLVLKIAFLGPRGAQVTYSEMDTFVAAHRVYRLSAIRENNGNVLQIWDETEGTDRRALQREIHNPPGADNFLQAVRIFKATSDSALVIGDHPKTFSGSLKNVTFESVDGLKIDDSYYPIELSQMRFVPAGTRRFVVHAEGTGFAPLLDMRTLPEVEVEVLARHIYRFTARRVDNQYLVQLWDETYGADQRTLVNEFRFGEKKRADE
jgi:hypothetical protein